MLLFILHFGILARYFYMLVISILIVGEIFFLDVEDDDHLSSGFTENGAGEGGCRCSGLAFFPKGKVL